MRINSQNLRDIGHRGWDGCTGTRVKCIRLANVVCERDSNNNGKTGAALLSPPPPRSFFRRIRPALAWQSEQIGRLNLSELQRGEFLHRRDLHQPPRIRALAPLPRIRSTHSSRRPEAENRFGPHCCSQPNEQTNARTHSVTRRCAHNRPQLTFYVRC